MLIPFKFLNIFKNEADDDVIEVMEDEIKEITLFNFHSLTCVNPDVSIGRYMEGQQAIFPLYDSQRIAIEFGISQNGRVFLADDKVSLLII